MRGRHVTATIVLLALLSACGESTGDLVIRASAGAEGRERGIAPAATADGWGVRFDHAVIALDGLTLATSLGDSVPLDLTPAVVELVPAPQEVFRLRALPAQRWDRFTYRLRPVPAEVRNLNVEPAIVERMQSEGWSAYYGGALLAPPGTVDADGAPVTEIPFVFGFPVETDYRICRAGTDGTDGVVVPLNSAATYEVTWHLTHLFFDSFVEGSALRVEPMAARWDGAGELTIDDLDVSLGSLRGIDGGPLLDDEGNPVLYIPGMTGADTLREFVLSGRPGHFDGLEGFCTTDLRILR